MSLRNYSGAAVATSIVSGITPSDTTFTLVTTTGWPLTNFIVTLGQGTASEEKVLVGTRTGAVCSAVTRGYDDTTAQSHSNGESARHTFSAIDAREANVHVNATTGVHGVTGALVDTSSAQTLAGKTLSAPVVNSPTLGGTPVVPAGYIPNAGVGTLVADLATLTSAVAGKPDSSGTVTLTGHWTFTARPILQKATTIVRATANSATFTTGTVTPLSTTYTFQTGHFYKIYAAGPGCSSTVNGDIYQMSLTVGGTTVTYARGESNGGLSQSFALLAQIDCVGSPTQPWEVAAGNATVAVVAARNTGSGTLTHDATTNAVATLLIEDLGIA